MKRKVYYTTERCNAGDEFQQNFSYNISDAIRNAIEIWNNNKKSEIRVNAYEVPAEENESAENAFKRFESKITEEEPFFPDPNESYKAEEMAKAEYINNIINGLKSEVESLKNNPDRLMNSNSPFYFESWGFLTDMTFEKIDDELLNFFGIPEFNSTVKDLTEEDEKITIEKALETIEEFENQVNEYINTIEQLKPSFNEEIDNILNDYNCRFMLY